MKALLALLVCLAGAIVLAGCRDRPSPRAAAPPPSSAPPAPPTLPAAPVSASAAVSSAPSPPPWSPPQDAAVEQVDVPDDLPAFVVRGRPGGERMIFVHGLCGNPYAYAWSFRNTAARLGTLVAIQGNMPCSGAFRDWSSTPEKVDARIESAFRATGDTSELRDLIIVGYSSGGTYAELLVMKRPQRYSRAILIANPRPPALFRLRSVRAAVLMAGERDRHDLMKQGLRELSGAGIPATFMVLPEASHGEMGPDAEQTMADALGWLLKNQRPPSARQQPPAP